MNKILASALFAVISTVAGHANASADKIRLGKELVAKYNCASCHGVDYNSPIDPAYPKLAGQHEDYLRQTLISYRRGTTAMNGRTNPVMVGQAKMLENKDVEAIAAYLHSLPGNLVLRK